MLGEDSAATQRDLGRDLFLWAVVQNNKELAEIAWEQVIKTNNLIQTKFRSICLCVLYKRSCIFSVCAQCRDCMSAALAASKILKKMAAEGSDVDEAVKMQELADHYEKHAIGIIQYHR